MGGMTWIRSLVGTGVLWSAVGCGGAAGPVDEVEPPGRPEPSGPSFPSGPSGAALTEPQWTVAAGLADRRCDASVSLLADGGALVTGGRDPAWSKTAWASADVFDPESMTWRSLPPMLNDRSGHLQVTLPDGRVLVAGGAETIAYPKGRVLELAELFDPAAEDGTGAWRATSPMPLPLTNLEGVLLDDGRVLAASAMGAAIFDPATETWTDISPQKPAGMVRRLEAGRVLSLHEGGTTQLFDPESNGWEEVDPVDNPDGSLIARFLTTEGEPRAIANERVMLFDSGSKAWVEQARLDEAPPNFGLTTAYGLYVAPRLLHRAPDAEPLELPELPATPCGDHGITLRDGRLLLPGPEATLLLELPADT